MSTNLIRQDFSSSSSTAAKTMKTKYVKSQKNAEKKNVIQDPQKYLEVKKKNNNKKVFILAPQRGKS